MAASSSSSSMHCCYLLRRCRPLLLLLLIISPPSLAAAAAAADQSDDDGTWPLQRPSMSVALALEVMEDIKGNPFDLFNHLPPPHPQQEGASKQFPSKALVGGKCTYTVSIKTSCSSRRITRDAVSLTFGDAYHNEVYAARLDDPASGTFERCSVDTFRILGPCGGRTCYLYLRRSGTDGWTPEYIKVFYSPSDSRAAVTFFYNVPLPNGVWYGFNLCHASDGAGAAAIGGGGGNTALPAISTSVMEEEQPRQQQHDEEEEAESSNGRGEAAGATAR